MGAGWHKCKQDTSVSASRILGFLLPTTTECWIVSGARWCLIWCWMGARKNWCWIGARWKKVPDASASRILSFLLPTTTE